MVLSRIPEERRTVRHRKLEKHGDKHRPHRVTRQTSYRLPSNVNNTSSASLTTAIANETLSSTSPSTDDTLSMISTPWSTETWRSPTKSRTHNSSSYTSWTNSGSVSLTSMTVDPRSSTTASYGMQSPGLKSGSSLTMTLLKEALESPSASRYVQPLQRQYSGSSPTFTSWTLETYTSTGLVSSFDHETLKVNYPWSPSTFVSGTEFSDYYPSSLTLISQKCSREGFGKFEARRPLTPMNYVVLTKDDHPMMDWILVKRVGIPTRKD